MRRRRAARLAGWLASGMVACATASGPSVRPEVERQRELALALRDLSGVVDAAEARRLAQAALRETDELAARYEPLRPPHLGNLAFHLGLRRRALCCHWVEDLLRALDRVELHQLSLHWAVAHHGDRLREHSAVLVVPRGAPVEQGLVLDPWRHSGRLYWTRVSDDHYPWRLHPSDSQRERLRCG